MKLKTFLLLLSGLILVYFLSFAFYGYRSWRSFKNLNTSLENMDILKMQEANNSLSVNINKLQLLSKPLPKNKAFKDFKDSLAFAEKSTLLIYKGLDLKNSSSQLYSYILNTNNNPEESFEQIFNQCNQSFNEFMEENKNFLMETKKTSGNQFLNSGKIAKKLRTFQELSANLDQQLSNYRKLIEILPEIIEEDKKYLVLLQNNMEIRPTGGFMGSYAKIHFKDSQLQDLKFEDIYSPDGQIEGYIAPPEPIQQAFKLGSWRLRDSNWNPHFPQAKKDIIWFFEQGGEKNINGLIAINLNLAQQLLKAIGPINLQDYSEQVNNNNFYRVAQYYAETDFFPGSTQKKDFLGILGRELVRKIKEADPQIQVEIAKIIKKNLDNKEILLGFKDLNLQALAEKNNWAGELEVALNQKYSLEDHFSLIEANLGVNKANCCIERKISHNLETKHKRLYHTAVLNIKNNNRTNPKPPKTWGGRYLSYLRFYIPNNSKVENLVFDKQAKTPSNKVTIKKENTGFKSVGFFINVPPLEYREITLSYSLNHTKEADNYQLSLYKQPGVLKSKQEIDFDFAPAANKKFNLDKDKTLKIPF